MKVKNYNRDLFFEITLENIETTLFSLVIKNVSDMEQSGVFCLQSPWEAIPIGKKEVMIQSLAPKETLELTLEYQFQSGGNHQFYGWIEGRQVESLWNATYFLAGSGYFSGDTHSHSVCSDGKSTLEENRQSMMKKGHSFLYSTDHNYIDYQAEIEAYQKNSNDFLHLAGWEFTSHHGHALAYGSKTPLDVTCVTDVQQVEVWQNVVDQMIQDNGIVFLAHPYEAPCFEHGDLVHPNLTGVTGIEVWNGLHHHGLAYQNRKSCDLWDRLNAMGRQTYVGNTVSDSHTKGRQGNPYIKGFMNTLSEVDVHQMLQSGNFFGSNGIEIKFKLNDTNMGGTYHVAESQIVNGTLSVFDPLGNLEEVILYRIRKCNGRVMQEKIIDVFPKGKQEKILWEKDWYFTVQADEFYRVEAVSSIGAVTIEDTYFEQGFALSNPIFIN